jgi:hypothetical protein
MPPAGERHKLGRLPAEPSVEVRIRELRTNGARPVTATASYPPKGQGTRLGDMVPKVPAGDATSSQMH